MPNLARIKFPSRIRLAIALTSVKPALTVLSVLILAPLAAYAQGSPFLGAPVAIKAMAAKLARLIYRMLRFGMDFIDRGAEFYEARMHDIQVRHLKWKAAKLGFQLTEVPAA
jgi:hypothetical protein